MTDNWLENLIAAATPGGIEAQEARGQRQFVNGATLPKKCNFCTRDQLEAMGIVFGADVDDLFISVTLPAGWRKERTDHSMWSKLLDDKGRERASIFYKAAFYDRDAFVNLANYIIPSDRYVDADGCNVDYAVASPTHVDCVVVNADGAELWRGGRTERDAFAERDAISDRRRAWLEEHYPDWRNPLAYWPA